MDYRKNPYGMNPYYMGIQNMEVPYNKVPFYLTYTQMNTYQDEMEYEKDMEKMKRMYPEQARMVQHYVEEECDKMEYDGSLMFDEYPDQTMLRTIAKRISDKVEEQSIKEQSLEEGSKEDRFIEIQGRHQYPPSPWSSRPGPPPSQWGGRPGYYPKKGGLLGDLVNVMLFNEIYRRRCRHHRCRRWW